jgi:hypothetical protein
MDPDIDVQNSDQLRLALAAFEERAPERDANVDATRISSVESLVESTMAEVLQERAGLVARMKKLLHKPGDHSRRAAGPGKTHGMSIVKFERVERRLLELDLQLAEYKRMKSILEKMRLKSGSASPIVGCVPKPADL